MLSLSINFALPFKEKGMSPGWREHIFKPGFKSENKLI